MKIRIYQVNLERDKDRIAFFPFDSLERLQGSDVINSSVYDKVFDGEFCGDDLEQVYGDYNFKPPEDYTGRSLSVSDIVEVIESEKVKPGFYFCDSIGFKEVEFDTSKINERSVNLENPKP